MRILLSILAALLMASPVVSARALAAPTALAPLDLADAERAQLATASRLLAISDHGPADPFARAVAIADEATRGQAALLGLDLARAMPVTPHHATASEAAFALLDLEGIVPTPEQRAQVLALDAQAGAADGALARTIDAFVAYDQATRDAFAHGDAAALRALHLAPAAYDPDPLAAAGVDITRILAARMQLMDASVALRDALSWGPAVTISCGATTFAPAFSIDLAGCSDMYTQSVALLIDRGGNDIYVNNAGGGSGPRSAALIAAALVDLGGGSDLYDTCDLTGICWEAGVNGGGEEGSGLLLDDGGDDYYAAGTEGTNGGGAAGVGALIDAGGNDGYFAGGAGANGGGDLGAGLLIDSSGDDSYTSFASNGANGGGALGTGLLFDGSGDDRYSAIWVGVNGGGDGGDGALIDGAGNDVYQGGGQAVNGGGLLGVGLLLDRAGDDAYSAWMTAVNGGGSAGTGLLADLGGRDSYADQDGGAGQDRTVAPKGTGGVQLDESVVVPSETLAIPTGGPTIGPDQDRDGIPAYIDVQRNTVTVGGDGLASVGPASPQRIAIDSNDNDPCTPACGPIALGETTPPIPSGAPSLGPDADGDRIPAYADVPLATFTVGAGGSVTETPAGTQRIALDPNDADPCVPACKGMVPTTTLPAIPAGAPTIGPDVDGDGIPSSVTVPMTQIVVGPNGATFEPAPPITDAPDPNDGDPCVPACAPSSVGVPVPRGASEGVDGQTVALPLESASMGAMSVAAECPAPASASVGGIALSGALDTGVAGASAAEPASVTALRCAAIGLVPDELPVP